MTFSEIDQSQTGNLSQCWTQEVFKHGSLLLEVAAGLIFHWIQAYGRSGMSKYHREKYEKRSIYFIAKETSLKSRKKDKIIWQVEYHHTLKEEKLCNVPCTGLEPGTSGL